MPEMKDLPNYWWHFASLAKNVTPQGKHVQNEAGCMKRSPFLLFHQINSGSSEVGVVSREIDSLSRERKDLLLLTEKQELTQGQIQQGER